MFTQTSNKEKKKKQIDNHGLKTHHHGLIPSNIKRENQTQKKRKKKNREANREAVHYRDTAAPVD